MSNAILSTRFYYIFLINTVFETILHLQNLGTSILQERSLFYRFWHKLFWAQNCSTIQRIIILQKKAIRVINLQPRNFHTSPLFKQNSILRFQDKICLENILFVRKSSNNLSPSVFNTWFTFCLKVNHVLNSINHVLN